MLLTKQSKKFRFSIFIGAIGFFIGFVLSPTLSWASACCGGGFAIPSLITGDDSAMLTTSLAYSKIDIDVHASGVWQKRSNAETAQILRVEAARIFKDRFQVGASLPVQLRNKSGSQSAESSGLGDISSQVGYEYLPDWDYNPWRPKGIGFLSLTFPTGKSIYESTDPSGIDSQGRGFWSLGLGTVLTKAWTKWDANSVFEVHRSFDKQIETAQLQGTVQPGYGGSMSLGTGYNIKDLRLGGSLAWTVEDAIHVAGSNPSEGSIQRFATGTVSASWLWGAEWASTLSYSDQSLFGDPTNSSLSKSIALFVQRRWAR
jgi:hypothetical protein